MLLFCHRIMLLFVIYLDTFTYRLIHKAHTHIYIHPNTHTQTYTNTNIDFEFLEKIQLLFKMFIHFSKTFYSSCVCVFQKLNSFFYCQTPNCISMSNVKIHFRSPILFLNLFIYLFLLKNFTSSPPPFPLPLPPLSLLYLIHFIFPHYFGNATFTSGWSMDGVGEY